jgi:hypothetical protein
MVDREEKKRMQKRVSKRYCALWLGLAGIFDYPEQPKLK